MNLHKKNKLIDTIIFLILLLVASVVTYRLFYSQTFGSDSCYPSDMEAYILEMQGLDSGYEFPYPVFFKLSALFHLLVTPQAAVALATMVLNSTAMVIVKLALNSYAGEALEMRFEKHKWVAGALISFVAVSLFFISMLFPPEGIYLPGIKHKYLGVFSANPFHNATYMAARPFAVLAFVWAVKLLEIYEAGFQKKYGKDYILFAVFLLVATMTKPSFTIVLVAVMGLVMVWRLLRSRFRCFLPTLQLGICFLPTFADLLYQYRGVFVPEEGQEGGIGFTIGGIWEQYCDNIPLAVSLAIGFPLAVLVLNFRELRTNTLFRLSWQIYLMSFLMAFFLYEKGFRWSHFNFSWGYMYGIFFAFLGAGVMLLQKTGRRQKPVLLLLQWLPYLWHVACGIYYFISLSQGNTYY